MSNYKTCWQTLEIEPIRDKKTIKRAYAKLLKTTRPDEDPEGFKLLHDAYTEALDYLKQDWYWDDYNDEDDFSDDENTIYDEDISDVAPTLVNASSENLIVIDGIEALLPTNNPSVPPPIASSGTYKDKVLSEAQTEQLPTPIASAFTEEQTSDFSENDSFDNETNHEADAQAFINNSNNQHAFTNQLLDLVNNPTQRNNIDAWEVLLADDELYDIRFKQSTSMQLLNEILNLREQQIEQAKDLKKLPPSYFSHPTLEYLNNYFGWQHNQDKIANEFYYHSALNQFYDDLEPDKAPILTTEDGYDKDAMMVAHLELAPFWKRFFAFVIDCMVISGIANTILEATNEPSTFQTLLLHTLIIMIIATLQSKTVFQASIGQRIFSLKLVTIDQKPVSYSQAISRFFLSLLLNTIGLLTLIKIFGFIWWGTYFIDKYRNKNRLSWLDTKTGTYLVKR